MRVTFQVIVLLVVVASISGAFGAREAVEYEGRISIKGNEPHTFVALSTDDEIFRLSGDLADELGNTHQNRTVSVVGYVEDRAVEATHTVIRVESYRVVGESRD